MTSWRLGTNLRGGDGAATGVLQRAMATDMGPSSSPPWTGSPIEQVARALAPCCTQQTCQAWGRGRLQRKSGRSLGAEQGSGGEDAFVH
uniref:Uncharacterized protein n=1 Tax=Triticum urartu TaxID=4572 RepID=A0A8R7PCI9_TRIUA